MDTTPNFCGNCGEKLDVDKDVAECPKCHSPLHEHSSHVESPSRIVEQLPYKSPGTTALIAFLGGLFALPGIGLMYVGKVKRGIIILIVGLVLYVLAIIPILLIISLQGFMSMENEYSSDVIRDVPEVWLQIVILMIVFGIGYMVFFIWQIFNARKLAKKFNEVVKTTGREPW